MNKHERLLVYSLSLLFLSIYGTHVTNNTPLEIFGVFIAAAGITEFIAWLVIKYVP